MPEIIAKKDRVYNFSAGPSALPVSVLEKAAAQMCNYGGSGMSVMEMSHRSADYQAIIDRCEADFRRLMGVPENYKILFLQGGASLQFSMVPMNLSGQGGCADFAVTGLWAKKAAKEAEKFTRVSKIADSSDENFAYIPEISAADISPDADFVHITVNNTIYGTRFTSIPDTGGVPLVGDISSCVLSEALEVSKFGILYAGAQKNLGPAGVTVVVVREDLLGRAGSAVPAMLDYAVHAAEGSMYNTPPTYAIYVCGLMLEWLEQQGGVAGIQRQNEEKAAMLYDFLDGSDLFSGTARTRDRSLMNVPFVLPSEELNAAFIQATKAKGFVNLKGHRSVGGMRASIYNAMPPEGVSALVGFMKEFEVANK